MISLMAVAVGCLIVGAAVGMLAMALCAASAQQRREEEGNIIDIRSVRR